MSFWKGAKTGAKYGSLIFAGIYGTLGLAAGPLGVASGIIGGLIGGAISGGLIGGIAGAVMEDKKPKPVVLEAPPVVVHTPVVQQAVIPEMAPAQAPQKSFTAAVDDSRAKAAAGVGGPA